MALDTETSGLDSYTDNLLLLQLGNRDTQIVIDCRTVAVTFFNEFIHTYPGVFIGHNIKFDYKFLLRAGIRLPKIWDTMLAECVLNCGRHGNSKNLAHMLNRYIGKLISKKPRESFLKTKTSDAFSVSQISYAAEDIAHLHELSVVLKEKLHELGLTETANLEMSVCPVIAEIEYNGMLADVEEWKLLTRDINKGLVEQKKVLDETVESCEQLSQFRIKYKQTNLFGYEERCTDINYNSPKQMLTALRLLKVDVDTTDQKELILHVDEHSFVKELITYKKLSKLSSSFGENFLDFINPVTGRIHQDIWQVVSTGRMSSSKPNLTNIPKKGVLGKRMRACFKAGSGKVLVGGDFNGCEIRIIAEGSQDPVFLSECRKPDGDLHTKVACLMFGISPDEVKEAPDFLNGAIYRDVAKIINFGLAYGMTEYKLSATLQIPPAQAKKMLNKYFELFPKVFSFMTMLGEYGKHNGCIRTFRPFRRIRWFDEWSELNGMERKRRMYVLGEIERASKNMPIQGTAGDILKLSLITLNNLVLIKRYPVKIVNVIHDEILTECDESFSAEWKEYMGKGMRKSAESVIKTVPMLVDCKINKCWQK